jgi:hypothetical protein
VLVVRKNTAPHRAGAGRTSENSYSTHVASKATKKERIAEAMRPFRELSRLKVLISREYGIKERTAENYRRHLDLISAESSVSEEVRRSAFREERELAFAL